jgi:hypothetical protein
MQSCVCVCVCVFVFVCIELQEDFVLQIGYIERIKRQAHEAYGE